MLSLYNNWVEQYSLIALIDPISSTVKYFFTFYIAFLYLNFLMRCIGKTLAPLFFYNFWYVRFDDSLTFIWTKTTIKSHLISGRRWFNNNLQRTFSSMFHYLVTVHWSQTMSVTNRPITGRWSSSSTSIVFFNCFTSICWCCKHRRLKKVFLVQ